MPPHTHKHIPNILSHLHPPATATPKISRWDEPHTPHHSSCLPSLSLSLSLSFCASNPIRISPLIHASIILLCDSLSLSLSTHPTVSFAPSFHVTCKSLVSLAYFLHNDFLLPFLTLRPLPIPITHDPPPNPTHTAYGQH